MDSVARDQVFISYSHKDAQWLERLQTHLTPYVRMGITVWDDTNIKPGQKWRGEIEAALARAKVAVLLVTPDFIASDFIHKCELPPLLSAAKKDGLTILWVPVRPSSYKITPIAEYQSTNDPANPLDMLSPSAQDRTLVRVCERVYAELNP